MIETDQNLAPADLGSAVEALFDLAGEKILALDRDWDPALGTPVFTVEGRYTTRGWTEWTQGFQFGCALLCFDATGEKHLFELARARILERMATHVSHVGVHDHGFNNISTYGNLLRLMSEGRIEENPREREFLELALKVSGAVQGARWTELPEDLGFVYSFNGPHSLFADTIRSMRSLCVAHQLGHYLMGERDRRISLLRRALTHAETTARFNVYLGEGRDRYDERGRVAHESVFNVNDGSYRCPSTQQGYSPFTTWTRGQAWILCGYAEQLEYLNEVTEQAVSELGLAYYPGLQAVRERFVAVAEAVADHYIENTPSCGVPYWDTGAPGLAALGDYKSRPADPYNPHEPVDSSAAAIAAQGLLRLGRVTGRDRYTAAGLTVSRTLLGEPYLSTDTGHQGLLLHSVYHRPGGWDHVPPGRQVPCGESSMWGDYHAMELAVLIKRIAEGGAYPTFFST
jgi:rhamnogalacturonyl hydrolase YesR